MQPIDYNQLAADYAEHRAANPAVLRALIEDAAVGAQAQVLEIGCGTGNYIGAIVAATRYRGWGTEPSAAMLGQATIRFPAVTFRQCPAEALAVPPASFDLVFSVDVIHHVSDVRSYMQQAWLALRPDGWLLTATDSEAQIRARTPLADYFPETVAADLARYPRIDDLNAAMAAQGFEAIHAESVAFSYALTDIAPYRARAYSVLHLIPDKAYRRGLARMEEALRSGPIPACSRYTLLWGREP